MIHFPRDPLLFLESSNHLIAIPILSQDLRGGIQQLSPLTACGHFDRNFAEHTLPLAGRRDYPSGSPYTEATPDELTGPIKRLSH